MDANQNGYKTEGTYVLAVVVGLAGTAEQLAAQEVPVVLQEGQVQVPEELHVLVLHTQLLRRVPVDDLKGGRRRRRRRERGERGNAI